MPITNQNVPIANVHKILEKAAQHILDARGDDSVVSRDDIKAKLDGLQGEEKALVSLFYNFADHRDSAPGARITKSDIDKTLDYAKRKLVERLDRNGDHELSNQEIAQMSRIGKLAVAIAQAELAPVNSPVTAADLPDNVKEAIAENLVTVNTEPSGAVVGARVTTDWDHEEILENLENTIKGIGAENLKNFSVGHISAYDSDDTYADALAKMAELGPYPNLKNLKVADANWDEAEISWIEVGDMTKAFEVSPGLEGLHVKGSSVSMDVVSHENLKTLTFLSGGLDGGIARNVGKSNFPNLETLNIFFGSEEYGADGTVDDIKDILKGEKLPNLKNLGLKNAEFQGDIAKALVDSEILPRLETVDLSMGWMLDSEAQVLLDNSDKFAHLTKIDVSDNYLSPDMVQRLKDVFGNALVTDDQYKYQDYDPNDPWRYVSVSE
jgi:hypothetical protein